GGHGSSGRPTGASGATATAPIVATGCQPPCMRISTRFESSADRRTAERRRRRPTGQAGWPAPVAVRGASEMAPHDGLAEVDVSVAARLDDGASVEPGCARAEGSPDPAAPIGPAPVTAAEFEPGRRHARNRLNDLTGKQWLYFLN